MSMRKTSPAPLAPDVTERGPSSAKPRSICRAAKAHRKPPRRRKTPRLLAHHVSKSRGEDGPKFPRRYSRLTPTQIPSKLRTQTPLATGPNPAPVGTAGICTRPRCAARQRRETRSVEPKQPPGSASAECARRPIPGMMNTPAARLTRAGEPMPPTQRTRKDLRRLQHRNLRSEAEPFPEA